MKKLTFLILLFTIVISCNGEAPKVLLYIEDGSVELNYMINHEVNVMQAILNQAGYDVIVATQTGEILETDSITLSPDIKLSDVNVGDYVGFIIPCMAVADTVVDSDEIAFVQKVADKGKPMAAQLGGVFILAKAGILNGKQYAYMDEPGINIQTNPSFKSGIFSGRGVVQDGQIITSGTCPYMAKTMGYQDGTEELTIRLINTIKEESQ